MPRSFADSALFRIPDENVVSGGALGPLYAPRGRSLDDRLQALDRGLHPEVGHGRVPLRVEGVERVDIAAADAQRTGLGVEVDGGALGLVHAAEIQGELLVHEDEDVVVAGEGEAFAAAVLA